MCNNNNKIAQQWHSEIKKIVILWYSEKRENIEFSVLLRYSSNTTYICIFSECKTYWHIMENI